MSKENVTPSGVGFRLVGQGSRHVIVMHGWLGDGSVFDPILPFLDHSQFTYAFMDVRSYGLSRQTPGEYTIAEMASDAVAVADHLGWSEFHFVGHSMAGMVAQWLAAHYAGRIQSLVGITPVPACGFPFDAQTEALFRSAKSQAESRNAILMHTTGNRLTPQFGHVMTQRSLEQTTPEAFDAYLTAWSQTSFVDHVQGLGIPFLVLVGESDPAVTPPLIQDTILRWFPKASLQVVQNAGHYPMVETPVALVTAMEAFINTHAAIQTLV